MIEFFMDGEPPTANHQNKRIIYLRQFNPRTKQVEMVPRLGDEPALVKARRTLETWMGPHVAKVPAPLTGAIALAVEFTFPWLSSHSARVRALGRIPKTTRPDCSNLAKTLEDRLAAMRFFDDDALVCELLVRKWYGARPGILVRIAPFIDEQSAPLFDERTTVTP